MTVLTIIIFYISKKKVRLILKSPSVENNDFNPENNPEKNKNQDIKKKVLIATGIGAIIIMGIVYYKYFHTQKLLPDPDTALITKQKKSIYKSLVKRIQKIRHLPFYQKVIIFTFTAVVLIIVFKIPFLSTFANSNENSSDVVEVEEAQPDPWNWERVKNEIKSIPDDPQKVVYVLIGVTVVGVIIISGLEIYAYGLKTAAIALQWRMLNALSELLESDFPGIKDFGYAEHWRILDSVGSQLDVESIRTRYFGPMSARQFREYRSRLIAFESFANQPYTDFM